MESNEEKAIKIAINIRQMKAEVLISECKDWFNTRILDAALNVGSDEILEAIAGLKHLSLSECGDITAVSIGLLYERNSSVFFKLIDHPTCRSDFVLSVLAYAVLDIDVKDFAPRFDRCYKNSLHENSLALLIASKAVEHGRPDILAAVRHHWIPNESNMMDLRAIARRHNRGMLDYL